MDKEEIVLQMLRILWKTYQALYPQENGFMFAITQNDSKDTYHLYKWSEMDNESYQPDEWYEFREEK